MAKKDPNIIREGDWVKVINPEIFIRCGYPMDYKEEAKKAYDEHGIAIRGFLWHQCGILPPIYENRDFEHTVERIAERIGYLKCKTANFGGAERKIFTERREEYLGLEGWVNGVRFVRTGTYYAPSGGYSYDGEYDYDPGGLYKPKTHKILTMFFNGQEDFEIEAIHVEKQKERN